VCAWRTGWNRFGVGGGERACFPDKTGLKSAEPKARSPRAGPSPRKFKKIDCRKRVFQAFQAVSSHFEGVGNSMQGNGGENWIPIPPTHPISDNSSVNDWSRGILLRHNRLSFPTRAVLPDNGRRDDTLPPPSLPKTTRQMAVLAIFLFRVFIKFFFGGGGTCPPAPRLVRLWSSHQSINNISQRNVG